MSRRSTSYRDRKSISGCLGLQGFGDWKLIYTGFPCSKFFVLVVANFEYIKNHWIVHFKKWIFTVCDLYLKNAVVKSDWKNYSAFICQPIFEHLLWVSQTLVCIRGAAPPSRSGGATVRRYPSSKLRSSSCALLEQRWRHTPRPR